MKKKLFNKKTLKNEKNKFLDKNNSLFSLVKKAYDKSNIIRKYSKVGLYNAEKKTY